MTEKELSRIAYHKEMELHKTLGPELFEKVYEECLFRYLKKSRFKLCSAEINSN